MTQLVIFPTDAGTVAVLFPAPNCGLTVFEIARKDVPAGRPFLIVNEADLPDAQLIDAWEADFSSPHGFGIGPEAWFAEQAAKLPTEGGAQ